MRVCELTHVNRIAVASSGILSFAIVVGALLTGRGNDLEDIAGFLDYVRDLANVSELFFYAARPQRWPSKLPRGWPHCPVRLWRLDAPMATLLTFGARITPLFIHARRSQASKVLLPNKDMPAVHLVVDSPKTYTKRLRNGSVEVGIPAAPYFSVINLAMNPGFDCSTIGWEWIQIKH